MTRHFLNREVFGYYMTAFKLLPDPKFILTIAAAFALLSENVTAQFNVPVYSWDFTTQSTTDTVNGVTATLANPAGLGPQGYTFTDVGEGITILQPASVAVTGTYAIELVFSLDMNNGSYQKIIDFLNFTEDYGFYVFEDEFIFYDYDDDTDLDLDNVPFAQDMTVRITRDAASKVVTVTLNGQFVWSFVDTHNYGVFSQANNVMHFFQDDGGEDPAGTVKSIRVFAKGPSAAEISGAKKKIKKAKKALKKAKKSGSKSRIAKAKKKLKKAKKKLRLLLAS